MSDKRFNITILFAILILLLGTGLFTYLNSFTGPRLKSFELRGEINSAEAFNQQLIFNFNRPIKKENFEGKIEISPEVKYTTKWIGNKKLFIFFSENLVYGTKYTITIDKNAQDIYGNTLKNDISKEITIKMPEFTYISKSTEKIDRIIKTNISQNQTEVLLEAENIALYGTNPNYLVAVTEDQIGRSDLYIKDLKSNKVTNLGLQNKKINHMVISPVRNQIFFSVQDVELQNDFLIPLTANVLEVLDLEKSATEFQTINPKSTANDIIDLKISPDGQYLLYRGTGGDYYIHGINSGDDVILAGKYIGGGDFSEGGDISFINYDLTPTDVLNPYVAIYSTDRKLSILTDRNKYSIDPNFFHTKNSLLFAEKYKEEMGSQGYFKIMEFNKDTNIVTEVLSETDHSLELPNLNPSDEFATIERYSKDQILNYSNRRDYSFQSKPEKGTLIIFDLNGKRIVGEIEGGVEARWIN